MEAGKLFVGGISWETSEERLREYFEAFGEVVEAVIMKDRTTGRARGFGFVVFANASVSERVVRERHIIDGRTVEAKKAVPRDDHQNFNRNTNGPHGSPAPARTRKIFVGGLASTVTDKDFKSYFDQFGTITDVVVMYDHNTQRPRGFGFITYDSEEAVEKVLFKTFHELNGKTVEVKRAVPKELSPGPKVNHGLSRVSSFVSAYNNNNSPVHGSNFADRFSRSGYPPYGLNLESGFGSTRVGNGDTGLGFGNGANSYFSGSYFSGSLLSASNDFLGNGGNVGGFGSANAGIIGSGNSGFGIGNRENNGAGRNGYVRNDGLYSVGNNVGEGYFGKLYGGDSFYTDHSWLSSSREFEDSAATNVASNNSALYDGGYSVTANRGIAA
ncbi:hypothetical protein ACP275_08G160200 [Erythranthe tilingii]